MTNNPTAAERTTGREKMRQILNRFDYRGKALPRELKLSCDLPVVDYFRQFPHLQADAKSNHAGFWDFPIPVNSAITMHDDEVVVYDQQGYDALRTFLKKMGCATYC